jgi:hypothetical protein
VTDDRLQDVPAEAQAERQAEVAWEPTDWAVVFRRRRLRQVLVAAALLAVVAAGPFVRIAMDEPPFRATWWLYLAVMIAYCGETAWRTLSARGRAEWEETTRQEIRVEHALRHHVSIGEKDRAAVTKRADELNRNSRVAVIGYPLLALVSIAALVELDSPTVLMVVVTATAVVVCGLLLTRSLRRRRWGTRWLADPLPREPADLR